MNIQLKYLIISNSFFVFAGNLLVPIYAVFIHQLGYGAAVAGILFGTKFISAMITQLFLIRIKDHGVLNSSLLKANYLLRGISWLFLIFFQNIYFFALMEILIGISEAIGIPAHSAIFSEHLDKERHISDWASLYFVNNLIIAIASIAGGFIVTLFGFSTLFAIMSILAFVSYLVYSSTEKKFL